MIKLKSDNAKLQEDHRVLKDLTKDLKREKRHFESESLKERARADQL